MDNAKRQIIGLIGCLLLAIGSFLPIVSVTFLGSINFVYEGQGNGIFVVAGAIIGAFALLFNRHRIVRGVGVGAAVLIGYTLLSMTGVMGSATGMSGLAASMIDLEWGWLVLIAGDVLMLIAAFWPLQPNTSGWVPLQ